MPRPRVTSQFIPSPVTSPISAALRIPAIIGEGATTFTVTEQVTRSANATDALANSAASFTRVGNYSTTTDYAPTTDYTATPVGGAIQWVTGHGPNQGDRYYVTYVYDKVTADYGPKLYDNFNDILKAEGPVIVNQDGTLNYASYLTMCARLMMSPGIGTTQIIIVQVQAATPGAPTAAEFEAALALLQNPVGALKVKPYYITPLGGLLSDGDVQQVNGACMNHAILMADPQFLSERRVYTGQKNNSSFQAVVTAAQGMQVDTVGSSRLTMAANFDPYLTLSTPTGSRVVTLDGFFAAAALAGYRSSQVVSQPALNKLIPVFSGFNTDFTSTQIDTLDDNGLQVMENDSGSIVTVNDVTINVVSDIEKSIPTVETRDTLISTLRRRLKSAVVGLRGGPAIPGQIELITDKYLAEERANGDIQAASPSAASLDSGTTTKYTVAFSYFPAGEVLEINIRFSIDLGLA